MKSKTEALETIQRSYKSVPYDGVITEVADNYVHVRLAGASRRIIHNVIIADHIVARKEVLYRGLFCKISRQYERENSGRWILTDILPTITYGNYAGGAVGIPGTPLISVQADCNNSEWNIAWQAVEGATYYQLYWSTDESGTGATLLSEQIGRTYDVAFDTSTPPKIFFAVRAVAGVNDGELSAWTTDPTIYSGGSVILFGDNDNHGHVTSAWVRWRVRDGSVEKSDDNGGSWADVTPTAPDDDFSQTPAPTATDINYIWVGGDDDKIVILGGYDDGSINGGWCFYTTDEGDTWADFPLYQGAAPTDVIPIWGQVNSHYIIATTLEDSYLQLLIWDVDDYSTDRDVQICACSEAQLTSKTQIAYIFTPSDNDSYCAVFGRMIDPGSLSGTYGAAYFNRDTSTWAEISDDLGDISTDWISSLIVGEEQVGGERALWYAREAAP